METKLPCDKHGEQIKTLFKQVEEFKSLQDIIYNLDKNTAVLAQTMKEITNHNIKQDKRIDEQHKTIIKINDNLTQLTESQRMLNEGQNELNSEIKILKKRVDENEDKHSIDLRDIEKRRYTDVFFRYIIPSSSITIVLIKLLEMFINR